VPSSRNPDHSYIPAFEKRSTIATIATIAAIEAGRVGEGN
jgi:hypothetical protein